MWIPVSHNSSKKPLARLKHALWMIENPRILQDNLNWNVRHKLHRWVALRTAPAGIKFSSP